MSKEKNELKSMNIEQLAKKIGELRAELFSLKIKAATEHVKDYAQFKKLRKSIARSLTFFRNKIEQQ